MRRDSSESESCWNIGRRLPPGASDLYTIDNENPQSVAPVKTNFPRLTLTTDYTMWRNAVECIVEVTGASLQQTVAQIISTMDGDTMYRAQNVLTELKQTLRGQAIANPINTIPELLDRLDRVLNKVGETTVPNYASRR
ncbi:Hypothetical protein FKW44_007399 [Caligus rogercresseyi]|uniref:Uncharacterized protein n=1 Tax=Caligus rogercresseyi TaxID=217165 RepID=A0A7T8KEM8_CALRO|nr:Hypothetical protein FKW44_007399 [Caligus rogercresseyi]